jgi:hypothetical protein
MQLIECAGRMDRDLLVLDTFDELHRRTTVDWRLLEIEVFYLRKYHAAKAIDRLSAFLDKYPDHKLARLSRSAIAWEMGRMDLVANRIEDLPAIEEMPLSYIRIAVKLILIGECADRAIDYAYRYLKLHFDKAEAHSALILSVINRPGDGDEDPNLPMVIEGAAVCYRELPDGPPKWIVLERTGSPDPNFEERSLDDPISQELLGKAVGDRFVLAAGLVDRVGEVTQILPKFVRRFQDSMSEMSIRFPSESANFQSLRIGGPQELDSGLAIFLSSIRERADQVHSLQALYLSQPIPIHLYAQRFGKNAYEAMIHLAADDSVPVRCSNSAPETYSAGMRALDDTGPIVLDLTAVATIRMLNLEDLLSCREFIISQDSALELREALIDEGPARAGGTLAYFEGRYVMYEEAPEQRAKRLKDDRDFCETVLKNAQIRPHLKLASIDPVQRETLTRFLGQYGIEAIALAMEPGAVLWTDDLTQGDLSASMFGARRIWTQAFLEHSMRNGLITGERYAEAVAKLLGMRYESTRFDNAVMVQAARLAGFQPDSWPFAQASRVFSLPGGAIDQLLRIALLFFVELLQECVVPEGAGRMLASLFEAFWQNPQARGSLLAVRRRSARIFGLNVIAEAEFNSVFDRWRLAHEHDVM